ncbi:hypothetical protein [uncultured Ilumatobacter sp.]|uniref:hypothetical protein n=1 Tax=uncultured Ilumatobacter sp. TaxID=879968 RepID=UPI00374EF27D
MGSSAGRSITASVVGWIIVVFVAWTFLGSFLNVVGFIIRALMFLIVVCALLTVYFRLRDGD